MAATVVACVAVLATPAAAHDSGFGLARFLANGALDPTFGSGGTVVVRAAQRGFVANALALQPDGKVALAGLISDVTSGSLQLAVARYTADGSPDTSFGIDGIASTPVGEAGAQANAVAIQADGKLVLGGTAFGHGTPDELLVARYTSDGQADPSFGTAGVTTTAVGAGASSAAALALGSDGSIVVAGTAFSNGATDDDFALVRYTATGQPDPDFGHGGTVTTDFTTAGGGTSGSASVDHATVVVLQPDGRIVVGGFTRGQSQSFAAARFTIDGGLDSTFGHAGRAQVLAREPQVSSIVLQASGDIILAGSAVATTRGTAPFALVRLRADGSPDEAFGAGGLVTTSFEGSRSGARAVTAQPDGKLISGGARFGAPSASGDALPESGFALARYALDGSPDPAFGTDGRAITGLGDAGATPVALAVQPDGKIIAAGLVFFQVAPPASSPVPILSVAAAAAVAVAALAAILGVFFLRRPVQRLVGK